MYMCVYFCVSMCVCIYASMAICMYVFMNACMRICMYMTTHTHAHTHTHVLKKQGERDVAPCKSVQPVFHDWCTKGRGMCYPLCGMVHIKDTLLIIRKSSPCNSGSGCLEHKRP